MRLKQLSNLLLGMVLGFGFSAVSLKAQTVENFVGVTPCRLVDTRNPAGTFGGPTMTGGTTRSFPIPSSSCNIPSTAVAYSLNFTVVPQAPLGFLSTWPTGQAMPSVSTLNAPLGNVLANAAIVPAGTNGAINVFVSNTTDVIIDINGYFAPVTITVPPSTTTTITNNITTQATNISTTSLSTALGTGASNVGAENTAMGYDALASNISSMAGINNVAVGSFALKLNVAGGANTAVGAQALLNIGNGNSNIAMGYAAGSDLGYGNSNNIDIGNTGTVTDSGTIRIGTQGTQTATYVAGILGAQPVSNPAAVVIGSDGRLGVVSSSRRFKEDIHEMGELSDRLMDLRPVTFRYKQADDNGNKPLQYGLIAEEVARVYPDLVVYNNDGQIQSVQYHQLPPLLLNELQKQHHRVEELEERIEKLEKLLEAYGSGAAR